MLRISREWSRSQTLVEKHERGSQIGSAYSSKYTNSLAIDILMHRRKSGATVRDFCAGTSCGETIRAAEEALVEV
jgi:hypothetical protein